ncbi:molybdenum cofactor guanylyltransferase MobA [Undibacterium sp. Di24W]|uniref:molybdenum cofactor guanylyltransferase MobA n=1 Tax=Undibacterium sp. Di24W TaxID=3413033 RepID=UPI003BEFE505
MIPPKQITGLILAGGRGTRMGQVQKGLQLLHGEPMLNHVLRRLHPQVGELIINANQDRELYAEYGHPLVTDQITGYAGPLAGLHAGLIRCETPFLMSVPCDSPFLPDNLVEKLAHALFKNNAQLAVVTALDSESEPAQMRAQPVFSLMETGLVSHLQSFLENGGRKITAWYANLRVVEVPFEDAASFRNINTLAELQLYNQTFDT